MPELNTLLTGVAMGESPRWHDGRLWFCDWGTHEVLAVELDGPSEVIAFVPSLPLCIDWLPDGRLLIVAGSEGRLLRRETDGSLVTHADLTQLVPSHPWNDIAVDSQGHAYVNNIGFDFAAGEPAPGTIAVVTPDGSARQVADGVFFPNGMAVARSSTLIVAESYASRLTAFDIEPDGSLSGRRVWAELDHAAPDGICIDGEGAVWYGDVPNKRCVRVREGGEVLQTVELELGCFACAIGGPKGQTLFMVVADWSNPEALMGGGERTGQVLSLALA